MTVCWFDSIMNEKSSNDDTRNRKGFRERIMDCIALRSSADSNYYLHDEEERSDQASVDSCLRELSRSPLSTVWNQYRNKKWLHNPNLPPLEELEAKLVDIVPSYSAL